MDFRETLARLLDRWFADAIAFLPNLLLIALILLLTIMLARRTQGWVRQLSGRTAAPPEIGELLGRMARVGILIIGVLFVLQRFGLDQAALSFIAGLGIAGIVIGFALQDIVKQFAAGVLLLMLRPFHVGDEVRIGAFTGAVVEIQLRATVLKTVDGDEVLIPNADVYTTAIVNMSRYHQRRRTIALTLPATSDVERTRATLVQAISGVPGVLRNPPPSIIETSLVDAAVRVELRFWVDERASAPDAVATAVVEVVRRALAEESPTPG
jgi:small conductance mechanosensitive channel